MILYSCNGREENLMSVELEQYTVDDCEVRRTFQSLLAEALL